MKDYTNSPLKFNIYTEYNIKIVCLDEICEDDSPR